MSAGSFAAEARRNLTAVGSHLDTCLYWPLLKHASEFTDFGDAKIQTELHRARLALLQRTAMQTVLTQELNETSILSSSEEKADLIEKAEATSAKLLERHTELSRACGSILKAFFTVGEDGAVSLALAPKDLQDMIRNDTLSAKALFRSHKIQNKHIAALYDFAFLLYNAGACDQASDLLRFYLAIQDKDEGEERRERSALWGQLVCDSLMENWTSAEQCIQLLREQQQDDENTTISQRLWLLHNSLFFYLRGKNGNNTAIMLDHLFSTQEKDQSIAYCQAIQCGGPHLMRYVVAAMIVNKKKRTMLRRVAKMVESEAVHYADPLTRFIDVLVNKSRFADATRLLGDIARTCASDYLLSAMKDLVVDRARQMLFEDQLRIHRVMPIPKAASELNMTVEQAELWLVNLIREAKIDATVDSVKQTVHVNVAAAQKPIWTQVLETLQMADRAGGFN